MDVREKLVKLIRETGMVENENRCKIIAEELPQNGVTVQEWISIKEPPKKRGEYLCYFKYEPESPDVICQNTYYGSGRWMSETNKVTHWMPLPKLPQPPKGE